MERLQRLFARFAEQEATGKSPLYVRWCARIIQDPSIIALLQHIPASQPAPNLFFAALQYVSKKHEHPLMHVFDNPEAQTDDDFLFVIDVCRTYEQELIALFQTKYVQTNEVQRASYLYPIFAMIGAHAKKPLTLIEIGTSAGLLLHVDAYQYTIAQSPTLHFGNEHSPLRLHAQNNGAPITDFQPPTIHARIGIDLHVVDLADDAQYDWLQCLIWPELTERKRNLHIARTLQQAEARLLEGDFRTLLPTLVAQADVTSAVVIFHTHVANQFSPVLKQQLRQLLVQLSETTTLYHVYNNMEDANLHVDVVTTGVTTNMKTLTHVDGHGHSFQW